MLSRQKLIAAAALIAVAATCPAVAAPEFQTPAPVAYLQDLSSGAILYSKDADRRMPPASMAKMMTVYVAFQMIKSGELKLDTKFPVRPETWRAWHSQGSTMFLSSGENVSVEDSSRCRAMMPASCWRKGFRAPNRPLPNG
jgi:serine-type D-Ala-D-Ala carboxypeptidase (penicillin-binding protein 5/6)